MVRIERARLEPVHGERPIALIQTVKAPPLLELDERIVGMESVVPAGQLRPLAGMKWVRDLGLDPRESLRRQGRLRLEPAPHLAGQVDVPGGQQAGRERL